MKIALVGVGYWGSKLLRNLVSLVGPEGVVVVDSHLDRLAAITADSPALTCRLSLDQALDDEEVGAVLVATPVASHAALVEQALAAGRHVFVEKPLTTDLQVATALVDLAEQKGLVLMVGHTFLFSPRVRWLHDHLRRDDAGVVHYLTSSRLNLGIHRSDANVLWDLGPHDASIILHLLGETPCRARASGRGLVHADTPDVAFIDLTFPSGVIASIHVSWMAPRKVRNIVVVSDRDMLVYDDTAPDEAVKVYNRGVDLGDSVEFGEHQLTYRYGSTVAPHITMQEPLRLELAEFLDAIADQRAPASDGRFALGVVAALAAADQSMRLGGDAVDVVAPALRPAEDGLPSLVGLP